MFTDEELKAIGQKVKNVRKRKGDTQEQLAEKSGISKSTISRIENGQSVKKEQLIMVVKALKMNVKDIFGFDTISDNIDDFISLFCKIMYSADDRIDIDGVINPEKLICFSKNNYLILYITDKLFTLFEDVAKSFSKVKDIKDEDVKEQTYKEYLQSAKNKYKKKTSNSAQPYYLISEKNLAQIIINSVESQKYFDNLMKSLIPEEDKVS